MRSSAGIRSTILALDLGLTGDSCIRIHNGLDMLGHYTGMNMCILL
jgi:hypothetical protein